MIINHAVQHAYTKLRSSGMEHAEAVQEAWWIIEKITQKNRSHLVAFPERQLSKTELENLEHIIYERTVLAKPLQYILKQVPFLELTIEVQPPTLIPRPETEEWCSLLIERIKQQPSTTPKDFTILDLCTGSGCIALALAQAFPEALVVGADIKKEAIALAEKNKKNNDIANATFIQSDLFEKLTPTFSLIISNPPYLSKTEWDELDISVKKWEDRDALVAENEGLAIYEKILEQAPNFLAHITSFTTQLALEISPFVLEPLEKIIQEKNYFFYEVIYDLADKPRALFLSRKK